MTSPEKVVEAIGKEIFRWLVTEFNPSTTLKQVPQEILNKIVSLEFPFPDFGSDPNALTCIALITFAYKLAGRVQEPKYAEKDMILVRTLAKNEVARRQGKKALTNPYWDYPLYQLLAGEVGDKIRQKALIKD